MSNQSNHTDVAISGGVICGSSISYYVAKAGMDCMLIEREDIASGTSSKCDGNISIVDKDPGFESEMSMISQELTQDIKDDLQIPFEYRASGSILVCDTEEEYEAAAEWGEIQREAGLKFNRSEERRVGKE